MPTPDESLPHAIHATALRAPGNSSVKHFFSFHPKDFEFWRQQTGVENVDDLEQHVLKIQREARAVLPYGCIRYFSFLQPRITSVPSYDRLIKLGSERGGAIMLDVGCCLGTDIRKVAADGWPAENILATDIEPEFWELGHGLFCSTADTFPASFVPGDIFDPTHLNPASEDDRSQLHRRRTHMPPLRSLTSLNPLRGRVAAIHAAAFFHLFSEDRQTALAHALASLLSREPGSMIVGWHSGSPHKGVRVISRAPDHIPRAATSIAQPLPGSQFCHSPESWAQLWDGGVFEKGSVKVESSLVKPDGVPEDFPDFYALYWSVTRL